MGAHATYNMSHAHDDTRLNSTALLLPHPCRPLVRDTMAKTYRVLELLRMDTPILMDALKSARVSGHETGQLHTEKMARLCIKLYSTVFISVSDAVLCIYSCTTCIPGNGRTCACAIYLCCSLSLLWKSDGLGVHFQPRRRKQLPVLQAQLVGLAAR